MLFDWFTVVAQLVNFLVLVWLMKRFLYKPILDAIDAREQLIAKKLAEAEAQRAETEHEREMFRQKNETFDRERDELMRAAKDEANEERQRLFEATRQATDELRAKRQEALFNEEQRLHDEIIHQTQEEVFAIARKTLADLAEVTLEECIIDAFSRRLRAMEDPMKEELINAINTSSSPVLVRSAFTLSIEQQSMISNVLKETLAVDPQIRFETSPEVVSGIELTANGQKVAWSIENYLVSLKKSVNEQLNTAFTSDVDTKINVFAHPQ